MTALWGVALWGVPIGAAVLSGVAGVFHAAGPDMLDRRLMAPVAVGLVGMGMVVLLEHPVLPAAVTLRIGGVAGAVCLIAGLAIA